MSLEDRYGLEVSTSSESARDSYVAAVDRVLSTNGGVAALLESAIEADPSFAVAHAAKAMNEQGFGRSEAAAASIETARSLVKSATLREQGQVAILSLLVGGRAQDALAATREHLAEYPRDAFALAPSTGVFGTIGFSGRIDREAELLGLIEPLAPHYGDDWWFQSVYAFALLETGAWARGRELAESSLGTFRNNPHTAHTLAHALYEGGADSDAKDFLIDWLPGMGKESRLYCHIWWHYSLLLMGEGDFEGSTTTIRENCLAGISDSPALNQVTDVASFLWRSELAGADRDSELWDTARSHYENEFGRPSVFLDAHLTLPYIALGQEAEVADCISKLTELGEAGQLPAGTTAARIAQSFAAFDNHEWDECISILSPNIVEVVRIGGSRAQRDLMTNTLLAAYVNAGRREEAEQFLERSAERQPSRPIVGLN